jgi:dTDP-4-amino-4,6-dideoxygalactose transaminase
MLANHGRTQKYDHDFEGVNSRLDGMQAAILNVKLRHLDEWTEKRRAAARRYDAALQGLGLKAPVELDDVRAVYHLYVARVPDGRREELQKALAAAGINTGIHYPIPLPYLNAYRHLGYTPKDFPQSFEAAGEILSLPMFPELTGDQVDYVAQCVSEAL